MRLILVSICILLSASAASGVILIDYGDADSSSTLGGVWNTVDSALSGTMLVDSSGAPSGVTISFGGDGWIDSTNNQGPWPHGDVGWVDADATVDYTFNVGGDTSTVVFSGLTPNGAYRFEHVAARELGADRIADYLVNGAFADSTPNGDDFASLADGWTGGNILVWESVAATAGGDITLTVTDVQNFGYINASRLSVVPEPSAGLLLCMALVGLASWRRQ